MKKKIKFNITSHAYAYNINKVNISKLFSLDDFFFWSSLFYFNTPHQLNKYILKYLTHYLLLGRFERNNFYI